jgi:hypothetical protein
MDMIIGTVFWVGLLILVLVWLGRGTGRTRPTPGQHAGPAVPPGDSQRGVDDALVDGLIIGHYLTRDHYRRQLDELESEADELRAAQDPWFGDDIDADEDRDAFDDDLDYAEFDAMGGFGVEPWAEDLFDDED